MPLTKPALSLGTAGETTREPRGAPSSENKSRDRTGRGEHGRNDFRADPVRAAGQGRWPCSREADFETRPSRSVRHSEASSELRTRPLTCVGTAGFEPATP